MMGPPVRAVVTIALLLGSSLATAQTPKYGGILRAMHRPDQEGLSIQREGQNA